MADSLRPEPLRHLVLVLGDQLDPEAAAFDGFDAASDAVWMAEVAADITFLHRKFVGPYLLAARLKARANVRELAQACGLAPAVGPQRPAGLGAATLQPATP